MFRPAPSDHPYRSADTPRYVRERPNPLAAPQLKVCPECAGPLVHASTCITCVQCGWGRCS